jgi:polyhydroxyalkanoate synthesis regulator phasin
MVTRHVRKVILAAMGAGYVAKAEVEKAIREIKKGGFSEAQARSALRGMIKDAKSAGRKLERELDRAGDRLLRDLGRKNKKR